MPEFALAMDVGRSQRVACRQAGSFRYDRARGDRPPWDTVVGGYRLVARGSGRALPRRLMQPQSGARYGDAAGTFRILAGSTALRAASGALGTAPITQNRMRPLYVQVAASLVVNRLITALAARQLDADGAAIATLLCEMLTLLWLRVALLRAIPGLFTGSSSNENA
jgi:hypothetical protein